MPVSTEIQQKTVLKALMEGPKTTIELRRLNILSPAPRVMELRNMGIGIDTDWARFNDSDGLEHRVGEYHYLGYDEDLTQRGEMLIEAVTGRSIA